MSRFVYSKGRTVSDHCAVGHPAFGAQLLCSRQYRLFKSLITLQSQSGSSAVVVAVVVASDVAVVANALMQSQCSCSLCHTVDLITVQFNNHIFHTPVDSTPDEIHNVHFQ